MDGVLNHSVRKERVIYKFRAFGDGVYPVQPLVEVGGALYGTADGGTACFQFSRGCGVVFSVTPSGSYTVIHRFSGSPDGAYPWGNLVNVNGTVFGTTIMAVPLLPKITMVTELYIRFWERGNNMKTLRLLGAASVLGIAVTACSSSNALTGVTRSANQTQGATRDAYGPDGVLSHVPPDAVGCRRRVGKGRSFSTFLITEKLPYSRCRGRERLDGSPTGLGRLWDSPPTRRVTFTSQTAKEL